MRVSVDPDDFGYNRAAFGSKAFLDGTEIKHCVTADEERRLVVVYVLDEHGKPMLTPDRLEVMREFRYGDVRIELSPAMNSVLTQK